MDFRGENRCRDTHESKTDKEALLFNKSKGAESKLAYLGHVLMENRRGLVVAARVTQATGTAEREAAVDLVEALGGTQRITLGADKNYDTQGFVEEELREMTVTPHVARNDTHRSSAIDGRTTAILVIRWARSFASGSSNASAGPRPSAACARVGSLVAKTGFSVCTDICGLQPDPDA